MKLMTTSRLFFSISSRVVSDEREVDSGTVVSSCDFIIRLHVNADLGKPAGPAVTQVTVLQSSTLSH